jgi:hypothetical protein
MTRKIEHRLGSERRSEIMKQFGDRVPVNEIADSLKLSITTVVWTITAHRGRGKRHKLTHDISDAIVEMYRRGEKLCVIETVLNVSSKLIHQVVELAGIPRRKVGRPKVGRKPRVRLTDRPYRFLKRSPRRQPSAPQQVAVTERQKPDTTAI